MVRGHTATTWAIAGLLVTALVFGAGAVGYVLGRGTEAADASASGAYLDDEYTYLGAVRSWPSEPNADEEDPFREVDDARLLSLGRTVCIRAADPGMDFDGMLDLLSLGPHQTYVVVTEAIDKLCPSHGARLDDLTS